MSKAIVSLEARQDLRQIVDYIAADNPSAAERALEAIDRAIAMLADMPGAGHLRPDLTAREVRFWQVRQTYLVIYRQLADTVEIVRVLDGRRDIADLLG